MILDDFINKANIKYNNKFDYSKASIFDKKITIICPNHGEFKQSPKKHLATKYGCKQCSLEIVGRQRVTTLQQFIDRANIKHNFKYDYSLVNFFNLNDKVEVICPIHGKFTTTAIYHLSGGCKLCGKSISNRKRFISDLLDKCKSIHNDKYDYSKVKYSGKNKAVEIICPNHGSFFMTMNLHLKNKGCKKCESNINNIDIINKLKDKYPEYNYPLEQEFKSSLSIDVICPKHNIFKVLLYKHFNGVGCPKCSNDRRKISLQDFLDKAYMVHGDKYDYSEIVFDRVCDKLKIRCYEHGYFYQRAGPHIYAAHGCPKCSKIVSKEETEWLDYLGIPKEYRNYKLMIGDSIFFPDGYCPETKTVYEFYGDYWHGNINIYPPGKMNVLNKMTMQELYDRTMKREKVIELAGYSIFRIWQFDWQALKKAKML